MSNHRASIGMFQKKVDYPRESRPIVPDEIFEAALRVVKSKNSEIIKSANGLYLVQYSESGPWINKAENIDFLPVWVARIQSWCSGGIKTSEMENFLHDKDKNNV